MKLSRTWLSQYINLPASDHDLEVILTNVGLELEGVEDSGAGLRALIVGEVRIREKHPNADKLSVCTVFDGTAEHTVVCGAPNVAAGQKIAFAPVGAHLPAIDITIGRRTLRGVESAGMICSAAELGLSADHSGIMVLDDAAVPGTPLVEHLGLDDSSLEIGITPNRGDALSHIGVARDIAASTGAPLRMPHPPALAATPIPSFDVRIDAPLLCPRYSCASIRGVRNGESPVWMQRALERAGIRPISILVDVTNYVMLEIGQPMHAFDRAQLQGDAIIVRPARAREPFVTLDGKSHELPEGSLLICDDERPVAIAGVMGGQNSEISAETRHVLLESAHFNASSVRRTARTLGVSTESSYRFERGTDPAITIWALERAAELILAHAGGEYEGLIDCLPAPIEPRRIDLHAERTNRILGYGIPVERQAEILRHLMFGVVVDGGVLHCTVPTFRSDIERPIDLVEEIARINGYDAIPVPERIQIYARPHRDDEAFIDRVRGLLLAAGLDEVLTPSLVPQKFAELYVPAGDEAVRVLNPVSAERPCLRSSLLASLLETVDFNLRNGTNDIRIFELGSVFHRLLSKPADTLDGYQEHIMAGILLAGTVSHRTWHAPERQVDFHDMKGIVENLLAALNLDKESRISYDAESTLTDLQLRIDVNGVQAGHIMQIRDTVCSSYNIGVPVMYAELSIEVLAALPRKVDRYRPVSRYPVVYRDLAIVVDEAVHSGEIVQALEESNIADLRQVRVVDVFRHASLGVDKKSLALSMELQPVERTLTEQEISSRMQKALELVKERFQAILRG